MGAAGEDFAFDRAASSHERQGSFTAFDVTAALDQLVQGTNVLAVQVHNTTIGSSDLSFIPRLVAVTNAKPDTKIFVRGDRLIEYGMVMEVMGRISAAGFKKVSLLAELPKPGKRKSGAKPKKK